MVVEALGRRARRIGRKGAFYARKLAWMLGRERFTTPVGVLTVPRRTVSPTLFYHLTNGDYEAAECGLLQQYLKPGDRVIELGAGIGYLANVYGRRCPGGGHLAIEASPIMAGLVRTNTAHLGTVEVLNALAARMEGPPRGPGGGEPSGVPFYLYKEFWASSMQPIHLTNPGYELVDTVRVQTVDLDALIAERRATMLVCDIEGGEYALLQTFAVDVPTILMELHWRELGMTKALALLRLLEARGYELAGTPDVLVAVKPGAGAAAARPS